MKGFLTLALVLATTATFAASTGTLYISGMIDPVNELVITPTVDAVTLNIAGGEVGKLVGVATEKSNNRTGYKILISSANASKLVDSIDGSKYTSYTLSYDGSEYTSLSSSPQQIKNVTSLPGLTSYSSNVKVNVNPYPNGPAGLYQDTVTVSIVANN